MRVLFLADRSFAMRERAMLSRLEIGLADEGARVVLSLPDGVEHVGMPALSARLPYPDRGGPLVTLSRLRPFLRQLDDLALPSSDPADASRPIDIVHAFGDGCWNFAADIARETGAAFVADVWSSVSLTHARRLSSERGGRSGGDGATMMWLAPDVRMHEAIQRAMPSATCRPAPWGVHVPPARAPLSRMKEAFGVALTGSGHDAASSANALRALGALSVEFPQMLIFIDAAILHRRHSMWREARDLSMLDRVSILEDFEGRRELVMHADALVYTEALGEHRTILLDAMAGSMVVVAQADPTIEALADGRTAVLVDAPTQAAWQSALRSVLEQPPLGVAVAENARAFVEQERLASAHVRAVLSAYEWLLGARPIAFGEAGGRVS